MNIGVLGAGAWGTALAISLAGRHDVTLWARDTAQIAAMRETRRNRRYLPDIALPDSLALSDDLQAVLSNSQLIIVAVPVAGLRATLQHISTLPVPVGVIWLCKGFETETSLLPHQIVNEILPAAFPRGALTGPSFAQEVARGLPTALTLASSDGMFAQKTAKELHHSRLRIYSSTDVVGVEIGGAIKNVLAIAAGICDGMQMGLNARAALLTRGLAEMTRLGLQMGGKAETLGGLSGVGDLILTCTGDLSRNRQVGMLLARHQSLPNILKELGHVAEGVYTAREVQSVARKYQADMPICQAVYRVLYEHLDADKAVEMLLSRQPGEEFSSSGKHPVLN
ncbi:MAG: NAD(P)-dependent glycerol-3-phosphate dehydrogenase [Gammaproteobacteria bacterium]|nr:NAD(P)-dependent glycerol-3-phosphate dehydrogenase [Gammaproteobacteria bacterium]MBU1624765.1 NAD(P)-dependent glycerol-3-phosphate dehydrogenase [Gammaproteobacteria bacterium]MBU1982609.1 NAD(P)-dependent glycerol-3-phosphate dehydrogenase [Gammaproteobacteria bacterium]